jgi:molybdenum cofactor guanylyltransferase
LHWMLRRAVITGALVTIPRANGRPQPLCAVYHRNLLGHITASLLAGDYKVMPVISAAAQAARFIDLFDAEAVASADPELYAFSPVPLYRWFHNCNTPQDMTGIVWSQ